MNAQVETRLFEIVATELQVPVEKVVRGVSLRKELGMDSVAAVNIVFAIEEEYGIRVPEAELEHVDSVDAILALVERLSGNDVPATRNDARHAIPNGRPNGRVV